MMDTAPTLDAMRVLELVALLLGGGAVSGFLAQKLRVPDVVLYLLAGILLGPTGVGALLLPTGSAFSQMVLIFGASYILFEGGAGIRLVVLGEIWVSLVSIATLGVAIMTVVTGTAAHWLLGLPLLPALLLGAVIASTDPATLVPVFRQVHVKERLAQMVVAESAFNDAVGAVLTFALLALAMGSTVTPADALLDVIVQAGIGLGLGAALGYLAAFLMGHERYGFLREYAPLVTLMAVAGAYLGADGLHASGFMAVFTAGILVGNRERFGFALAPGETRRLHEYVETTSLMLRMAIFMLLGAQVRFGVVSAHLLGGLAVVAVFMLLARPLTVLLCTAWDPRARWSGRELLFLCWTRETGVIPGALAGMLLGQGAPEAETVAAVTFLAILSTLLLQATSTRWLADRLGLLQHPNEGA